MPFASAKHTAPLTERFSAQADRAIQLSKIELANRLPLGARLESTCPRKVSGTPSLIPESHRDGRESIDCCHCAVDLLSICCRFAVTLNGALIRGPNSG